MCNALPKDDDAYPLVAGIILDTVVTNARLRRLESPMIRVVATHVVPEENFDAFKALAEKIVPASQKDPGNIYYVLSQSVEDPKSIAMIECWESMEALQAHMQAPHFQEYCPQMAELCAEPPAITVFSDIVA